jgi:hypothetical protein
VGTVVNEKRKLILSTGIPCWGHCRMKRSASEDMDGILSKRVWKLGHVKWIGRTQPKEEKTGSFLSKSPLVKSFFNEVSPLKDCPHST